MIDPKTALDMIAQKSSPLPAVRLRLTEALGHVMAEAVRSPISLPVFDNSAMDGYAVRVRDTAEAAGENPVRLSVAGTIYAGDGESRELRPGSSFRIMTGAPVPRHCDAVIPQEQIEVDDDHVLVAAPPVRGQHIRRRGEELARGTPLISRGATLHPGAVACLATVGRDTVRVIRKPSVTTIATGDETVPLGQKLRRGQVYDSNSCMLDAMLSQLGIPQRHNRRVKDNPGALARAVRASLESSDVVILIGGVSVGEHDFVRPVLKEVGVREVFWRVKQKPGKPLYFGAKGRRLVFGLPGNPASAFVCFYVYVLPALRRLAGVQEGSRGFAGANLCERVLSESVMADPQRWLFLKGKSEWKNGPRVAGLPHQGSHMVSSLVDADALIVVPPTGKRIARGEALDTIELPYSEEKSK